MSNIGLLARNEPSLERLPRRKHKILLQILGEKIDDLSSRIKINATGLISTIFELTAQEAIRIQVEERALKDRHILEATQLGKTLPRWDHSPSL